MYGANAERRESRSPNSPLCSSPFPPSFFSLFVFIRLHSSYTCIPFLFFLAGRAPNAILPHQGTKSMTGQKRCSDSPSSSTFNRATHPIQIPRSSILHTTSRARRDRGPTFRFSSAPRFPIPGALVTRLCPGRPVRRQGRANEFLFPDDVPWNREEYLPDRENILAIREEYSVLRENILAIREEYSVLRENILAIREEYSVLRENVLAIREDYLVLRENVLIGREEYLVFRENVSVSREFILIRRPVTAEQRFGFLPGCMSGRI
jgi:hypothetical protein